MGGGQGAGFQDFNFGDIFGDIFGGGDPFGRRQRSNKGSDLQYSMTISLEDAVRGVTEKIAISCLDTCSSCDGTGAEEGSQLVTCDACGGSGQVRMQQGFFSIQQTCPNCRGAGRSIKSPCQVCSGSGRV